MKVKAGGAVGPFHSTSNADDALKLCPAEHYDLALDIEFHESAAKTPLKIVPCTICKRPMVVNTFYVLAWAKCDESGCSGNTKERGSIGVAQAGRTDPELAANLAETLINPTFARAICPVHPDDESHEMELKSVTHNDHHGPFVVSGYVSGRPIIQQTAKGETVMHQCSKCLAVVTYSTAVTQSFRRVNEPRTATGAGANGWGALLGVRDE